MCMRPCELVSVAVWEGQVLSFLGFQQQKQRIVRLSFRQTAIGMLQRQAMAALCWKVT